MRATEQETSATWIRLLVLYTAANLIEVVFWGQLGAFTPLHLPQLGVPPADVPAWTGWVSAAAAVVGIPLLPFWGALADRYARRPIIIRSYVAHALAGTLALLAGNVWVFLLARCIQSFALGNSGLMMATLAERTPRARQGLAFSILNGAGPLGAFLGPLLGGPIVDAWGFAALMAVDVALMLAVIAALTLGYRDTYAGTRRGPLLAMAADSVGIVVRSPRLRTLFPALFVLFAGWMLAITYAPVVVGALYQGTDPGTAVGLVLGAGGLVTLVLSPVFGALADRYGQWRVLVGGGALLAGLWLLPLATGDLFEFGAAWAIINGLGSGVFAISFSVLADSTILDQRGRVMAFAYLPVNVGGAVGPALGSLAIPLAGVFVIFPLAALLTALGVGALLLARRQPIGAPTEAAPAA